MYSKNTFKFMYLGMLCFTRTTLYDRRTFYDF